MYQLLALLTGVTLAVMISINGNLSAGYGVLLSTVIIHLVGSAVGLILCLLQREKRPLWTGRPRWIYLGGILGVAITFFNNMAYGKISVTAIVALGLLGQTAASLAIDTLGLFGARKQPFKKTSVVSLAFALVGIAVMLDKSVGAAAVAAGISVLAGVMVVTQRMVNARLGDQIGALRGSLVNHLVGLPVSLGLLLAASGGFPTGVTADPRLWIYAGGAMGVAVVLLCNVTVPRLPVFKLTVLTFVGQVFAGIALDLWIGGAFSPASFTGGLIVAFGILVGFAVEKLTPRRERSSHGRQAPPEECAAPLPSTKDE